MELQLNNDHKIPLYKQIAQQIEMQILNGKYDAGSILPTERQLALKIGVNRSTVTAAYNELRHSGLVYSKQGSGTVVSDDLWDITPTKAVNWQHSRNVLFSPSTPIIKRVLEASKHSDIINFSVASIPYDIPVENEKMVISRILNLNNRDSNELIDWKAREVISTHLKNDWKIPVNVNEILLTSSVHQSLLLLVYCLLNHGDVIAIEGPSYIYTTKLLTSHGIKIVKIPVNKDGIDPKEIRDLYKKHRIRMIFTSPTLQNPTGTTLPLKSRKELVSICRELKIPIIEIDCTSPLLRTNSPSPPSLYELDYNKEIVIHVGSFYDTLGPSIELGWILGGHTVFEILRDAKNQMGLTPSRLTMQFVIEYMNLKYWNNHLSRLHTTLNRRKDLLLNSLEKHIGNKISYTIPDGGLNLWARINIPYHSDFDLLEACIHNGVLIIPGTVFGEDKGHIRISYSKCNEDQIDEGVKRLSRALENIKSYL